MEILEKKSSKIFLIVSSPSTLSGFSQQFPQSRKPEGIEILMRPQEENTLEGLSCLGDFLPLISGVLRKMVFFWRMNILLIC